MSIQQLIKDKDRKIQQLQQNVDEVLDEYQRLDDKYFHCLQDGKDKQREIDRLNNIINTGEIPQIQELERQIREWKKLAEIYHPEYITDILSIHNGNRINTI